MAISKPAPVWGRCVLVLCLFISHFILLSRALSCSCLQPHRRSRIFPGSTRYTYPAPLLSMQLPTPATPRPPSTPLARVRSIFGPKPISIPELSPIPVTAIEVSASCVQCDFQPTRRGSFAERLLRKGSMRRMKKGSKKKEDGNRVNGARKVYAVNGEWVCEVCLRIGWRGRRVYRAREESEESEEKRP